MSAATRWNNPLVSTVGTCCGQAQAVAGTSRPELAPRLFNRRSDHSFIHSIVNSLEVATLAATTSELARTSRPGRSLGRLVTASRSALAATCDFYHVRAWQFDAKPDLFRLEDVRLASSMVVSGGILYKRQPAVIFGHHSS